MRERKPETQKWGKGNGEERITDYEMVNVLKNCFLSKGFGESYNCDWSRKQRRKSELAPKVFSPQFRQHRCSRLLMQRPPYSAFLYETLWYLHRQVWLSHYVELKTLSEKLARGPCAAESGLGPSGVLKQRSIQISIWHLFWPLFSERGMQEVQCKVTGA